MLSETERFRRAVNNEVNIRMHKRKIDRAEIELKLLKAQNDAEFYKFISAIASAMALLVMAATVFS